MQLASCFRAVAGGVAAAALYFTVVPQNSAAQGPVCVPTADALVAARQYAKATEAYIKALGEDPKRACAVEMLKAIDARSKRDAEDAATAGCARAADLERAGRRTDATAKYLEILKARDKRCARDGLKQLRTDPEPIEDLRDWMAPIASALGLAAILTLAALVIGAAVFVALSYWARARRVLKEMPVIGKAFAPRVEVAAFGEGGATPAVAGGVTNLTRMHLRRLARRQEEGGSDYRLDRITGVEGVAKAVGRLADLAPQLKTFSALLSAVPQLARLPRYTVNGSLQALSVDRAGLTVILDHQHQQGEGVTLWSSAKANDPSAHQALAAGAAAWADFMIREREGVRGPAITGSGESYAYLRTGVQLEGDGRGDEARGAYLAAVRIDPTNTGALLNLSVGEARRGDFASAVTWLEMALSVAEDT